jgi:hypothetical protein
MHAFDFYSGKAAYGMLKTCPIIQPSGKRKVLFVHTGGLLMVDQLSSLAGSWRRMDLEEFVHAKLALVRCSDSRHFFLLWIGNLDISFVLEHFILHWYMEFQNR